MSQVHQEVTFAAAPAKVYAALMESAQHSAFTGAPAEIAASDGGAFSTHGGHITGRTIELSPGSRIVQAWRAKTWPAGVYSIARFELSADGKGSKLVFDQDGVPADAVDHITKGWQTMYWDKLAAYFKG